jgi:hypothetical protein
MSLEFLRRHGGRRMRSYIEQPFIDTPEVDEEGRPTAVGAGAPDKGTDLSLEIPEQDWRPIDITASGATDAEIAAAAPRRFVDGSHIHQTIAWLRSPDGHPVPVVLAEIGGICVRAEGPDGRALKRECEFVERVVSMSIDPFPWNEVEEFAAALVETGLRLLPARPPEDDDGAQGPSFDFERMREQARIACLHEMATFEETAWNNEPAIPTLLDGRLGRFNRCGVEKHDVVGVIKQQRADYLHERGWRVLYDLEPGQRTPAFRVPSKHMEVVSWYLKLDGADGAMPNWGVVRVEVPAEQFDSGGKDFRRLDRLSQAIMHRRCRQGSYARAPVSLEPIVRAEDLLKSLFVPLSSLTQHFYRITGL